MQWLTVFEKTNEMMIKSYLFKYVLCLRYITRLFYKFIKVKNIVLDQ